MDRIGLAYHEELARAVDNCGAAFTVRSMLFKSRTEVRQQGAVTVRAAVLTDDESERYFGASLADRGIQVIWLSVENASDLPLRFLPIVTDPNYFSAPEVERLLRVWWPRWYRCIDCIDSNPSLGAGCDSAKAIRFGLRLLKVQRTFRASRDTSEFDPITGHGA